MTNLINVGQLDRTTYLGGSDIANILGIGFETPLHTYLEKIGMGEPLSDEKKKFFERRKRTEPRILEELVLEEGLVITSVNKRYRDSFHDFMAVEIDFEFLVTEKVLADHPDIHADLLGTVQNGEIKSSSPFAGAVFGEEGSDEIPIHYCAQSMYGLGITDRQVCLYGVMTGLDDLKTYVLERDDELIKSMEEKARFFWHVNVCGRLPPDPVNNDDLKRLLDKTNGRPVEVDDDTLTKLDRLKFLRSLKKTCEDEEEVLKFEIGLYIAKAWNYADFSEPEDNAILTHRGSDVGKWRKQSKTTIDAIALRGAHPDIARKFQKTSHFRVLK